MCSSAFAPGNPTTFNTAFLYPPDLYHHLPALEQRQTVKRNASAEGMSQSSKKVARTLARAYGNLNSLASLSVTFGVETTLHTT